MVPESRYCQVQAIIPEVKQLFQSRRYIQCANLCERFLTRYYEEIHPVHKVYLHFYFALVHDTMARETTLRHRSTGLDSAEQHYRAAIDILTPSEPYNLEELLSPSSPLSDYLGTTDFRHMSRLSFRSTSSSTSSDEEDRTWDRVDSPYEDIGFSRAPSFRVGKQRPTPITTSNAARAFHEEQFSAEMFALLSMLHTHLRGVKELKSSSSTTRTAFTRPRNLTMGSRPGSRHSSDSNDSEMDQLRCSRKNPKFRPRFDPSGIRKLCNEVLAEL